MSGKLVIYETRGRAKEFCPLAINLYSGCGHRCTYCYGPDVIRRNRQDWYDRPVPRLSTLDIQRSAARWMRDIPRLTEVGGDLWRQTILLCFVTDPYQPIEEEWKLTRQTIKILHTHGFPVTILTKAGPLAQRDFDLLGPADTFATTLTTTNAMPSIRWEPRAGLPGTRLHNLWSAKNAGIQTWASLEPVIDPDWTYTLIHEAHTLVSHFKIGTMNYAQPNRSIDWKDFATRVQILCDKLGVGYYIKKDLAKYLGYKEGFWSGV